MTRSDMVGVRGYYYAPTDRENVKQQITPFMFYVPFGNVFVNEFPLEVRVKYLQIEVPDIRSRIEDAKAQAIVEFKEELRSLGTDALHEKLNEILWLTDYED